MAASGTQAFALPRKYYVWGTVVPDAFVAAMWLWLLAGGPGVAAMGERFRLLMLLAVPAALLYGVLSLHHPTAVALDDEGITLSGYGRAHRFRWAEAAPSIRLRGFLVRDRLLLRIGPSHPWRGRYWLTDRLQGYEALVAALQARSSPGEGARSGSAESTSSGDAPR
ncbi:MAG TPA: hypothetical protein VG389_08115 [Myxococcota bacterium]|jgi:hypothetical protein|nr:hypothetical protein [Myxococcota bacterium]